MPNIEGRRLPNYTLDYNFKARSLNYAPELPHKIIPIVIDSLATDSGNTGYTYILRAGLPMARVAVTTDANYGIWFPVQAEDAIGTATDMADLGLSTTLGLLASNCCKAKNAAGTYIDTPGELLIIGTVREADILIDYLPYGAGTTLAPTKAQILLDFGARRWVIPNTASTSTFDRGGSNVVAYGYNLITVLAGASGVP